MIDRQILERKTPQGNIEVVISQGGYDFVNIKGTTTCNIYPENGYLNGAMVLECYNLGNANDSFKNYVKYWLKEIQK